MPSPSEKGRSCIPMHVYIYFHLQVYSPLPTSLFSNTNYNFHKRARVVAYRRVRSMKILCFIFGIVILLMTTQVSVVDCRSKTLQPTQLPTTTEATGITNVAGQEHVDQDEKSIGKTEMKVPSCNKTKCRSNLIWKMKELAHKLASGPSKRGPGH